MKSLVPPGGNGTISLRGLVGHSGACACAEWAPSNDMAKLNQAASNELQRITCVVSVFVDFERESSLSQACGAISRAI
ncbi:MAG TPA: hypothetical protein VLA61_13900 [Ideonella sp.]|uniref:hypothetical protein n=1 Tax=Ideonella sp. TaxID=1929293 RepID=UPI002BDDA853|nr:hypothetical protein [Ideonella sp.]HSI49363.1 hypothetical protein [Ideonella sp.]